MQKTSSYKVRSNWSWKRFISRGKKKNFDVWNQSHIRWFAHKVCQKKIPKGKCCLSKKGRGIHGQKGRLFRADFVVKFSWESSLLLNDLLYLSKNYLKYFENRYFNGVFFNFWSQVWLTDATNHFLDFSPSKFFVVKINSESPLLNMLLNDLLY